MLTLLVNSYACCPGMGSEPGMGWNWISALARYCEIYVISEGEFRKSVESFLNQEIQKISEKSSEYDRWAERIHFYWIPVSDKMRRRCWNQGNWLFYFGYERWQRKVEVLARDIVRVHKIDVLYQLNMIGFREPGYLWRVSKDTGIPFVWGPIDAKAGFPMDYARCGGLKYWVFLYLKTIITRFQLRFMPRVRFAVSQASLLMSASSNSQKSLKNFLNRDTPVINETGCRILDAVPCVTSRNKDRVPYRILWVGKKDYRKQLGLALEIFAEVAHRKEKVALELFVVGGGDESMYKTIAKRLHIEQQVFWVCNVLQKEVLNMMFDSNLLLFTSVAEGTPHVVCEALSCGLPVVCFDTCGQGDTVISIDADSSNGCGIKIPLSTPEQSVRDFADAIVLLEENRELLSQMSKNCRRRAEELTWDKKAQQVVSMLHDIC